MPLSTSFHGTGKSSGKETGEARRRATISLGEPS
jgi:hypothetical protein